MVKTTDPNVEELINSIVEKLAANRVSLAKARSGRLDWRWNREGILEIKVHPEL